MTDQEVQLLSDTVKVGFPILGTIFGAVLGAVSTYFVTRLNYSNDQRRAVAQKRLELVLEAANDVTEFEHLAGTYACAVSNHVQGLTDKIDMDEAFRALASKNQSVRRARMHLKLLGLKQAEAHLEEYIELTREVIAKGPHSKMPRISELAKIIAKGPVKFYESLSTEFPGSGVLTK